MPKRDADDLSGHWSGYYTQHDHRRPISADFVQSGDRLRGRMNDGEVDFEASVSDLAMEEGLPPGADEQIVEQVRSLCPEAPGAPVRAEIHLPASSIVEGEVQGRAVRFLKRYQGSYFAGYRVGDVRVGVTGEDQEVHYRGLLNDDGTVIEGQWLLQNETPNGLLPSRTEGGFVLKRDREV